ncbi:hypothetical protein C8F04DRAFT_1192065 [Mycena alexandri]|uniref:Uncharacterized protein n=1 Tax=Mycena alexandri TaxID=1745969 RepID=A0AAD6WVB8_9AGAR|nr:hypothetical protein C8F04DRAFT_1192065 [Mycena alexandri]
MAYENRPPDICGNKYTKKQVANLNLREGAGSSALFCKCLNSIRGKDSELVGLCLERLGDINYWEGSYHDSSWSTILLAHSLKQKEKLGIYKGLQFMGDIFLQENDEATAISLFMLALQCFTQMDVHRSRAECMIRLGDISEKNGDLFNALELWEMARPLFERSSQTKHIQATNKRIARVDQDLSVPTGKVDEENFETEPELDQAEAERVAVRKHAQPVMQDSSPRPHPSAVYTQLHRQPPLELEEDGEFKENTVQHN